MTAPARRLAINRLKERGALARRFAPARCVVLDDGGTLAAAKAIGPDGRLS